MEGGRWSASRAESRNDENSNEEVEMSKTVVFDVKGMTCDNCVHHVTEAAKQASDGAAAPGSG